MSDYGLTQFLVSKLFTLTFIFNHSGEYDWTIGGLSWFLLKNPLKPEDILQQLEWLCLFMKHKLT